MTDVDRILHQPVRKVQNLESRPRTVAVVEDDPSMRKSIERLLVTNGFVAEGYSSAEAFLSRTMASQVDCLVLDIHLDGISGVALRQRLRASGSDVPVIFITAIDDEGIELNARRAGCVAYLRKPFAAALLLELISKTLPDHPTD